MYILKHGIKKNPERRWALPDRIFFGHGACAILAGTFLRHAPLEGFHAERILPAEGFAGNHIYVTDGLIAFDYHGYSGRERLLLHHEKGWAGHSAGWHCTIEKVDFDLLDTTELNRRKMLGPDQYLHDPIPRACRFLERVNHVEAAAKASAIASGDACRAVVSEPRPRRTLP
ncbi:MAG: hypothetical protein J0I79_14120 [Mesorhizobium sp.]|uniref:hypothetical protein n=1 Tax=Mesorhizobium sp. TaxID=1871066 RepID=UPI001ACEAF5D|nr:hypothetical protein [Mesorhizobium sp.]MBN9219085.1 hypothetical protein [Mesorhizobium sp.]